MTKINKTEIVTKLRITQRLPRSYPQGPSCPAPKLPASMLPPSCPDYKLPCFQVALLPNFPTLKQYYPQVALLPSCPASKLPCFQVALPPSCPGSMLPCPQVALLPSCPTNAQNIYGSPMAQNIYGPPMAQNIYASPMAQNIYGPPMAQNIYGSNGLKYLQPLYGPKCFDFNPEWGDKQIRINGNISNLKKREQTQLNNCTIKQ